MSCRGRSKWMPVLMFALGAAVSSCKSAPFSSASSNKVAIAAGAKEGTSADPRTPAELVASYDALATEIIATRKREVDLVRSILQVTYNDARESFEKARGALKAQDEKGARTSIENLATLVGYLSTEGDASITAVRKRLVEGGHHYNPHHSHAASGEGHHSAPDGANHAKAEGGHAAKLGEGSQTPAPGGAHNSKVDGQGHAAKDGEGHHAAPAGGHAHGFDTGFVLVDHTAKKAFFDASRSIAVLTASPSADALESEWKKVETTWNDVTNPKK